MTKNVLAMLDFAMQRLDVRRQGQDGRLEAEFATEGVGSIFSARVSTIGPYLRPAQALVDRTILPRGFPSTTNSGPVFSPRYPPGS